MLTPQEVRARIDRVTSFPLAERERIYQKYFRVPSSTVRFLAGSYGFDRKRILDVACHYGYHLIYFGEGSQGIDGSPEYLRYARDMGLSVQVANIEEPLPTYTEPFDGLLFSGTLEEILSPHVMLMRFRKLLKPDGLLCLRVPSVPPAWFDRLIRLRYSPGYDAAAHLYFFTPRLLKMVVERAGYDVLELASAGIKANPLLRPLHSVLLPLTPAVIVMARPRPNFKYFPVRTAHFLPSWANELAEYHHDYEPS